MLLKKEFFSFENYQCEQPFQENKTNEKNNKTEQKQIKTTIYFL